MKRLFDRLLNRTPADPSASLESVSSTSYAPAPTPYEDSLPSPVPAMTHYIVVVLDSCRYDTLMEAAPQTLRHLGPIERRWSYASWTGPSHYNLLMGLLPHSSPQHVYASEYYKQDFLLYNQRLGTE